MNIVWKYKERVIYKSGDSLSTRRSADAITVSYGVDATPSKGFKSTTNEVTRSVRFCLH